MIALVLYMISFYFCYFHTKTEVTDHIYYIMYVKSNRESNRNITDHVEEKKSHSIY